MRRIIFFFMFFLVGSSAISAQSPAVRNNHLGKWKFEAPYAPEGYTSGTIEFTFADEKYSAAITFSGSSYTISGEKTKVEKDTVTFTVFVEGTEVVINLKEESNTKMTGKAVYFEGEIPLTLTREQPRE